MSLNTSTTTSATEPFSAPWLKTLEAVTSGTITLSGAVTGSGLVGSTITTTLADNTPATKIADGTVSNTEFQYLNGVTSAIQTQLDGKLTGNALITGATKTKITYDAKGLVTAGADATTADIADSTNKRYVTDSDLTKLSNLSGTNTGDQNVFSTIAVAGQNNVVADSTSDTLTLVAGSNITLTTSDTGDSVTIASTGGGSLSGSGTANQITYWTGTTSLGALTTATYPSLTELSYVKGVTSAIQTQLNGKEPTITAGTSSQYWRGDKTWQTFNLDALTDVVLTSPTNGQVLGYNGTNWVNTSTGASGVTGSGASGRVAYWDGTSSITSSSSFTYDATNADLTVGTGKVGDVSGFAMFAHSSNYDLSNYGYLQDSSGATYINAKTGQAIRFRINNSDTYGMNFDGTYWTIGYDGSNKMSMNCSSTGVFSFAAFSGTSANKFTFNSPVEVPDSAYGAGWNGSTAVPTRNAVYDKIESITLDDLSGVTISSPSTGQVVKYNGTNWANAFEAGLSLGDIIGGAPASFAILTVMDDASLTASSGFTFEDGVFNLTSNANQFNIRYDISNYMQTTVSSAGVATFDAVGSGAKFVFSDAVEVPDSAYGAGWNGSTAVPTRNAVYDRLEQMKTECFIVAASDETTAITAGTNKVKFRMPYAFTVTAVRASLSTAQASGNIFTVDINESGTSILSTKLTIDNTETTSTTAATPAVISDTALADDAEISIDVDQIGNSTAKGLKVTIIGFRP